MRFDRLRQWLGIEIVEVSGIEKIIALLGGAFSILALLLFSFWALPLPGATAVVASMGASAVLLFAVPHGQLSQPWPVVAGHGVSALIGVACARYIPNPVVCASCAVGLAIGAMLQLKCVHPPGGATAFTAAMGGASIHSLGFGFVLFPVLTNAVTMVLLAVAFNAAFKWRRYPAIHLGGAHHSPSKVDPSVPTHEEILAAIRSLDSFVDISEEDLLRLVALLSSHPTYQSSSVSSSLANTRPARPTESAADRR